MTPLTASGERRHRSVTDGSGETDVPIALRVAFEMLMVLVQVLVHKDKWSSQKNVLRLSRAKAWQSPWQRTEYLRFTHYK
jgi:hypothetical protein